jgi:hypothetical protein
LFHKANHLQADEAEHFGVVMVCACAKGYSVWHCLWTDDDKAKHAEVEASSDFPFTSHLTWALGYFADRSAAEKAGVVI